MGLGIAVLAYAWMINHDIRRWLAAMAVAPLLLDGYLLQLEQLLLSDTLFSLMVTTAFVVLLWRRRTKSWTPLILVGALLGLATTTRTIGVGLIILGIIAFALRKPSWKGAAAILVAAAIPLVSYALWFQSSYGEFGLTEYSGAFLYARVMPWSDCTGVSLTRLERTLCDPRPPSQRPSQNWYMWASNSPLSLLPGTPLDRSKVAGSFAQKMVLHDPGGYLRAVGGSVVQTFAWHENTIEQANSYNFITTSPVLPNPPYDLAVRYQGGVSGSTRVIDKSLARDLVKYEHYLRTPGPIYLVAVLLAMGGAAFARGSPSDLRVKSFSFGMVGAFLLLIAPFTVFYDPRYVLAALPLCCLGFASGGELVLRRRHRQLREQRTMGG
jgi:hypothetical protein